MVDFAFYDNESPNGFSWPDVDMAEELREEFSGQYPDDLIESVAHYLEINNGPWGLDNRDDDFDEAPVVMG